MDLLVLGGGYGTRLFGKFDISTYKPKGLVEIAKRPCIDYLLSNFNDGLLDKIFIETNNESFSQYSQWAMHSKWSDKIRLLLEPISSPFNCKGVLSSIDYVYEKFNLQSPLIITAPDNYFSHQLDDLITGYTHGVRICTVFLRTIAEAKKFGVVELDGTRIIRCNEKPENPSSNYVRTSCEIWDKETFNHLKIWNKSFPSDKVGDFIMYLINKGINVESFQFEGFWSDIGCSEDLLYVKNQVEAII